MTENLGKFIRGYRKNKGFLTQKDFARHVGCESSHINKIETGQRLPSLRLALKIEAALGMKNHEIFNRIFEDKRDNSLAKLEEWEKGGVL